MKLSKDNMMAISWSVTLISLLALIITLQFYFYSLVLHLQVWAILYSSLLILISSISGIIIYVGMEDKKTAEMNKFLAFFLGFIFFWGFTAFKVSTTLAIVLVIIFVIIFIGWIFGKTSDEFD